MYQGNRLNTHAAVAVAKSDILQKSYAQVVKENPARLSSEKPWTKVKYSNKKDEIAKKKFQK